MVEFIENSWKCVNSAYYELSIEKKISLIEENMIFSQQQDQSVWHLFITIKCASY